MYRKIPDRETTRDAAAQFLATDGLSDAEIARHFAITRRTLTRWKQQPEFQCSIDEHRKRTQQAFETQMLLERRQRIANLDSCWRSLQTVIKERANSPEMEKVPGGTSGLLRRRKVFTSQSSQGGLIADYEVDKAVLQAMRRLEVLASKLLGQWQMPLAAEETEARPHPPTTLLTAKQERGAILLADAHKSDNEVAAACGINRRTLARWKQQASFQARIAELRAIYEFQSAKRSIANKCERLRMLSWRLQKLDQIVRERAKSPEMQSTPGGQTGIIMRRRRLIGRGARAFFVDDFLADCVLLSEERRHLAQAANELGQWRRNR